MFHLGKLTRAFTAAQSHVFLPTGMLKNRISTNPGHGTKFLVVPTPSSSTGIARSLLVVLFFIPSGPSWDYRGHQPKVRHKIDVFETLLQS